MPLKGLPTVHEPAESLLQHIFRNFGLPENVVPGSSQQFILLVYAVKEILDSRCHRGCFKYLTDWEVNGPEERSWVTQDDNLESILLTSFQVEHLTCPSVCICISSHSRSRAAQILNSVTQSLSGLTLELILVSLCVCCHLCDKIPDFLQTKHHYFFTYMPIFFTYVLILGSTIYLQLCILDNVNLPGI